MLPIPDNMNVAWKLGIEVRSLSFSCSCCCCGSCFVVAGALGWELVVVVDDVFKPEEIVLFVALCSGSGHLLL